MKKLFVIILLFPLLTFAQKIKVQNGSKIGELKEVSGKYCIIGTATGVANIFQIQTDNDTWEFIDPQTEKKIKFDTTVSILNFMDKNGWEYVSVYVDTLKYFIFKRKEISN